MDVQKGAQFKDTSDRGCAWYADQNGHHVRTVVDCTQACKFIKRFNAGYILADRGYDSNSFIEYIEEYAVETVISPRKNRKIQREYDYYLYPTDIWSKTLLPS